MRNLMPAAEIVRTRSQQARRKSSSSASKTSADDEGLRSASACNDSSRSFQLPEISLYRRTPNTPLSHTFIASAQWRSGSAALQSQGWKIP